MIFFDWIIENWIEVTGAILGIGYVFLPVKQNILTWLLGFLTSAFYIVVFLKSGFYADMGLQIYYVWISVYGWIIWSGGIKTADSKSDYPVSKTRKKQVVVLSVVSFFLWLSIGILLSKYTDSVVPIGDSFTTAMGIVATWMLARKMIEHWIIWVIVDLVSAGLYLWKGLYPTVALYIIYTFAAIWGYIEWKKSLVKSL
ncbi:MAG TPA: nicotinamide riboside transporter PnuC [Prolixibacteraceae bacterium]|nr:nicotinamide riboside transporter PnuC [Prolixibacteraceae bacterium]